MVQVPVGKETLGRIINVIGEPVDEQGPVSEPLAIFFCLDKWIRSYVVWDHEALLCICLVHAACILQGDVF